MRQLITTILSVSTLVAFAQIKNTKIAEFTEGKYPPLEPAVVINPTNSKHIVAATALDRIIFTKDGGNIWLETSVKSPYGVFGDPVLISDPKGMIHYFHLADPSGQGRAEEAWLDRIVAQKTEDGGITWTPGTFVGLDPPKDNDKPWAASHPKKDFLALTWTQFDKYGSADTTCKSNIVFAKSTSKADRWSVPIKINRRSGNCLDDDYTAMGATPFVDLEGRVFVTWANRGEIFLDRSFDGGETWLRSDISIGKQLGGWNMNIPGLGRCNGLPVLQGDISGSPFRGSLYVVYADQRFGENNTDVWLTKSPNRGDNWSEPVKVATDPNNRHQFMPWAAVDQTTGILYVLYYDRRNYPEGDLQTDVYLAWSIDGGSKFSEIKISETPFTPDPKKFFGDYTNVTAFNGTIAAVWTRMDDGKTSVMASIIRQELLLNK